MPAIPLSNRWIQDTEQLRGRQILRAQLDALLADARQFGVPDHITIDTIASWAAERAYEAGGYSEARTVTLDALEGILLREAYKTNAA